VRREFGKIIFDLQKGEKLSMPLSRPMGSVSSGVAELRVRDRSGTYRVFYYTKLAD
jgi:phage-related protein